MKVVHPTMSNIVTCLGVNSWDLGRETENMLLIFVKLLVDNLYLQFTKFQLL